MNRILYRVMLALPAFCLPAQQALADTAEFPAASEKWKAECGSCHVAYPPRLLPAPAWGRVMAGLERHFGTDASLDARSEAEIGAFLQANAGRELQGEDHTLRITETAWFQRQHAKLVSTVWIHRLVKTRANCGACHAAADRGEFGRHRSWFRMRDSPAYATAGLGNSDF